MSPSRQKPAADPLALVAALGRRLSFLHRPADLLLAYCQTAAALCPRLASIHIAFFSPASLLPLRVFYWDAGGSRLLGLAPGRLSPHEKKQFRAFSHRTREAQPGGGGRAKQAEDLDRLNGFFRAGEAAEAPAPPPPAGRCGPRVENAGRAGQGEPLPLRLSGLPEGWVFFTAPPRQAPWDERGRNAVSLCTDMLAAALERAGLFSQVLRAKREWEHSMDAIRDVVMIVDPAYTVIRGNRHLGALAGVPVRDLRGRKCHRLLAARKDPCPECPAGVTFATGEPRTSEVLRPRTGAQVEAWSSPLADPADGRGAVVVYEKDVTEIRRMQGKLVQAEKMAVLGELAAAVAHELNNPLSGVIAFSKILLSEMDPAMPCVEDLKTIEGAALRCKKIVQDLLTFARKPGAVGHEPVGLDTVLEQVHALLRPRLEERGVRLSCSLPPGLPALPFHPDLLHQLLVNLVVNGMDASAPGGAVAVSAAVRKRKGERRVVISVRDRGQGIPREVRDRIFEPFYSTKGPGQGTGLGLSICRKLMDAFGGEIEVSSPGSGGTQVSLCFPLPGAAGAG